MTTTPDTFTMFALYDRHGRCIISSHSGPHACEHALAAAAQHRLTGYLSVVEVDGWGRVRTGRDLRGIMDVLA